MVEIFTGGFALVAAAALGAGLLIGGAGELWCRRERRRKEDRDGE